MMRAFSDVSKIGILMIGAALLVIAGIAAHFYLTFMQRIPPPSPPSPFNAYCRHNAVIIRSNQELKDVRVLDNSSNQICFFERIAAGSEELCVVGSRGLYVVQAGDHKDVVECWEERVIGLD